MEATKYMTSANSIASLPSRAAWLCNDCSAIHEFHNWRERLLLARSGHADCRYECPLSGV